MTVVLLNASSSCHQRSFRFNDPPVTCTSVVQMTASLTDTRHNILISTSAFEFLLSQNMFLVSNVLLGMANAQLNNILNDELDNFKRACVLNLHKLWQKYKSATSSMLALGRC